MPGMFLNEALVGTAANAYARTKPMGNMIVKGVKASAPYINKAGKFAYDNRDNIEHTYHIAHNFKNGKYDQDLSTIKYDLMNSPKNVVNGVKNTANDVVNGVKNTANDVVNGVKNNVPFKEDKYLNGKYINDFVIGRIVEGVNNKNGNYA